MAESANLMMKAKDILANPSHEGFAIVVNQFYMRHESDEYKTGRVLYDFCVVNFPNCLTLKLLKVYHCSSDGVVRFRSIVCLSETLKNLRTRSFELSLVALHDIKPLLISCLTMQKATKLDTSILRIIVSFVASDIGKLDNGRWDELGDCILSLANTDPLRAFSVFLELPPVYGKFIDRFLEKFLQEVNMILLHPDEDKDEDWTLALETATKMAIQLLDSENNIDNAREILGIVLKSANELVRNGKEQFLRRSIQHLKKFLAKEGKLCKWSNNQCGFLLEFAYKIAGIGTQTKEIAKKIYQKVTKQENYVENPSFKLSPSHIVKQDNGLEYDRYLYYSMVQYSPMELLTTFKSAGSHDRSKEIAIRRLHDVLCDHSSNKRELDVSEIGKLRSILIECLQEEGMSENLYRILGQVVYHVALHTIIFEKDPWFDLWDYIASESKAEFKKAVYVFQCLTMRVDNKDFVIPAIANLSADIFRTITPPRELLVDNSSWVLAFTGAFCAIIHLLKNTNWEGYVKEIAHKMVDSVEELVERGMEVGLVRRAFRDLEIIVKKQLEWYETNEYKFLKSLLWRLYAIEAMKWESKIVLWRINVILERAAHQLPKAERVKLDWLNQPNT